MRTTTIIWTGLAAAAGLSALLLAAGSGPAGEDRRTDAPSSGSSPTAAMDDGSRSAAADAAPAAGESADAPKPPPLPSHAGTIADGGVTVDDDGNVVPDRQLKRLFEYFLTGLGRDDLQGLRDRLRSLLRSEDMPAGVRRQVLELFDRYIEYRRALADVPAPSRAPDDLRAALDMRYSLRRRILGEEMAEGFFARDEALARYAVESRRLQRDESLTEAERRRQLELLEQSLPEDVRRARERSRVVVELNERTSELQDTGASEAEIQAMREELVGSEAAQRLAELDEQREQWRQRLEAYRRERDRILASEGLDATDKQAAIDRLIESRFDEHEARRVRALDSARAVSD